MSSVSPSRFGIVAFVGRPNSGKSTLLNRLLAEKIAIVSDKPQTTRQRILGILTSEKGQILFLDTPGTHRPLHRLNRRMMQHVTEALRDADVVCLLHDATTRFGGGDAYLLELLRSMSVPRLALLNKIDRVAKPELLPQMARFGEAGYFDEILPISALTGEGCAALEAALWSRLPEGEPRYERDWITLHSQRFLVLERIREQVLAHTRDELPYTTAVVLESWQEAAEPGGPLEIHAAVLVERASQRKILVGRGGQQIKSIGIAARESVRALLDRPVRLFLFVRVEADWRDNQRLLSEIDREFLSTEI